MSKTVSQKLADNAGISYYLVVDDCNEVVESYDNEKDALGCAKDIAEDSHGEYEVVAVFELKYMYFSRKESDLVPFKKS